MANGLKSGINGPKGDLFVPEERKITVTLTSLCESITIEVNTVTSQVEVLKRVPLGFKGWKDSVEAKGYVKALVNRFRCARCGKLTNPWRSGWDCWCKECRGILRPRKIEIERCSRGHWIDINCPDCRKRYDIRGGKHDSRDGN